MASPWLNTFENFPANNDWCIIRVPFYYGPPVRARFKRLSSGWCFYIENNSNRSIPFYFVPRYYLDP